VALAIVTLGAATSSEAKRPVLVLDPKPLETEQADEPEAVFKREGFAIGVGLGSALFLGSGEQSYARTGGGSFSLRLGTSAGENLLWFVQLDAAAFGKKNSTSLLGLAAHYYFRERLWARGGISLANLVRPEDDGKNSTEGGLALVGGLGTDVYRRGIFAVDIEVGLSHARYENGSLSLALLQLMANWY
jgi:hypothetical protein